MRAREMALTLRVLDLAHRLDVDAFLTGERRDRVRVELDDLIAQRERLRRQREQDERYEQPALELPLPLPPNEEGPSDEPGPSSGVVVIDLL